MKKLLPILTGILCAFASHGQLIGPNSARGIAVSALRGSNATWNSIEFAGASDDKFANFGDIPGNPGSYTDYLLLTDFGFSLPPSAVIKGIIVKVERLDSNGLSSDYSIRIVKAGVIGNAERSTGKDYPIVKEAEFYGASYDLWGESWTSYDISKSDFGVAIAAQRNALGGVTAGSIDNVTITVFYGFSTLPVGLNEFSVTKVQRSVSLKWKTSEESDINKYVVERSADGQTFNSVKNVPALNLQVANYSTVDSSPLAGNSFYRIRIVENSGVTKFSNVAKVNFERTELFQIFPSPVNKGDEIFVNNPMKEELKVQFFSAAGQCIGEADTRNEKLIMPSPVERTGTIYYRILNMADQLKGSGTLVIH